VDANKIRDYAKFGLLKIRCRYQIDTERRTAMGHGQRRDHSMLFGGCDAEYQQNPSKNSPVHRTQSLPNPEKVGGTDSGATPPALLRNMQQAVIEDQQMATAVEVFNRFVLSCRCRK
jgi:hypothetical protein